MSDVDVPRLEQVAAAVNLLTGLGYQVKPGRSLVDDMAAEYLAGMSLRQIGAKYALDHGSVRRWLVARGVTMRNRNRLAPNELARLRRAVGIKEDSYAA